MRVPASLVAIPFLAGAAAGIQLHPDGRLILPAACAAMLALIAGIAACADDSAWECAAAILTSALLTGVSLGLEGSRRAHHAPLLEWFEDHRQSGPIVLEGRLREDAAAGPFGVSLVLDVGGIAPAGMGGAERIATRGGVRLTVAGTLAASRSREWRAGRSVRATALLREPAQYRNPGVPDFRRVLSARGVVLVGTVKSAALVSIIDHGSLLDEAAAASRCWVRRQLGDIVGRWSRRSGAIATAILIGDRTGLPDEDERRLQEAGTYHVIAISGGNIAILTVLLLAVATRLGVGPRAASATVIMALVFYSQVAAPAASVHRAVLAAVAYLSGRLFDQKGQALNILGAVAATVVAATPMSITDPGFLLSFGATAGILVCVPVFLRARLLNLALLRAAAALLAATLAADLALTPIAAVLFGRVTFAGLLLNFLAIPLMTIVQTGSMAALAIVPLDAPAAVAVGYGVHLAAASLVDSARLVDYVPWVSIIVRPPGAWLLCGYYAGAASVVFLPRNRRRGAVAMAFALLLILTGTGSAREMPRPAGALRVAFLDVGQADATLVRFPNGRAWLVDAGGLPVAATADPDEAGAGLDVGHRVVLPALRSLDVVRLDTFVLTHPDPDHIGGARAVLRAFRPRAVWEGVPVPPHAARRALLADAESAGLDWRTVQAGERVRIAGVDASVLHPSRPDWERQRVRNEDSVVLELRLGGVAIILPGDIGREGEKEVVRRLEPARTFVVLKAPHHGSATSSGAELLNALRPAVVIFSAGRRNRFGHPAPSVVARYESLGTAIFSTADDGAVVLDTDGRTVHVRTWTGRQVRFEAR